MKRRTNSGTVWLPPLEDRIEYWSGRRAGGTDGFLVAPEAFADPELWKVRKATDNARRPPNERAIHGDDGVRPSYHSEWFPYGGYNLVHEIFTTQFDSPKLGCTAFSLELRCIDD